jgi:hypothetical protein
MNTTQEYDQESRPLPTSHDGANANFSNPWRIAKGKLFRGREEEGTLEERASITGRICEMQFNSGMSESGEVYQYAAVILESADEGKFKVHASLKSKVSASTFMEGLCQCKAGDDITISPNLGKPKPGYSAPTYANVTRFNPATHVWEKCVGAEFMTVDQWSEQFTQHPSVVFKDKDTPEGVVAPTQDQFADTPNEKIETYILERSWPALKLFPEAWHAVFMKILKNQYTGILTEEQFDTLETALNQLKTAPKSVLDAATKAPALDPSNL